MDYDDYDDGYEEYGDDEPDSGYDYEGEEDEDLIDGVGFADPGGNSSLRAATKSNPRNCPCSSCGRENTLTPLDVRAGCVCDMCADALEIFGSSLE